MGAPSSYDHLDQDTETLTIPVAVEDDVTGPVVGPADRFVCVVGADSGRTVAVRHKPVVFGRGAEIDLHSNDVSRRHARLTRDADGVTLEDLGSANGTFVNAAPIRKARIQLGDRIQIGSTIWVFTRHDELEERLQQLQKLDAMNALVKGLAHDFNNLLMVVQAGVQELSEHWLAQHPEARQTLDDMNRLDNIEITTDIDPKLRVMGSREELKNIFLNLILNARDAMPQGGRITIQCRAVTLDRGTAFGYHLPSDAEIVVQDTGVGMDEGTLARIFEPFFTTKAPGSGSGLGLAMIYSSIRNHRGAIYAESMPGHGTTFRIYAPVE